MRSGSAGGDVLDLQNNRSNATIEGGFLFTRRLAARMLLSSQRVHGGLRFESPSGIPFPLPGEVNTPERWSEHDRLLRDNNFRLGAGVAYSMQRMHVFARYLELLRGTDSHGGRAITFGISWPSRSSAVAIVNTSFVRGLLGGPALGVRLATSFVDEPLSVIVLWDYQDSDFF